MAIRFFCLVGLLTALYTPAGVAAAELSSLPLSRLYSKYSKFLDLPEEAKRYLFPRYKLHSKLTDPGTVKLFFTFENEKHEVEVDSDGYLQSYPSKAMLAADPTVYTDQPKDSMGLNLTIGFKMGEAREFDARLLHERVHKAFKAAKSMAGFLAVFAPSHRNIMLEFNSSCDNPTATYEGGGVDVNLMHGEERYATIPFKKEKQMRRQGTVKLSCLVAYAELG